MRMLKSLTRSLRGVREAGSGDPLSYFLHPEALEELPGGKGERDTPPVETPPERDGARDGERDGPKPRDGAGRGERGDR